MSSNGMLKPDRDFTKEVDQQIPEAQDLAKVRTRKAVLRHANDLYRATFRPR